MFIESKVYFNLGPQVPTWADGTDEEIAAALEAHYNGDIDLTDYWTVGDERVVHLSALTSTLNSLETQPEQDVVFVILNEGGKQLATPINGHNECAFVVGMKDCLYNQGVMMNNDTNGYGWCTNLDRWKGFNLENEMQYRYTTRSCFPQSLIGIFKKHINKTLLRYNTAVTETTDIFSLPFRKEIFGSDASGDSIGSYQNQLEYYVNSQNRIKKYGGGDAQYFTSTKYYYSGTNEVRKKQFFTVDSDGSSLTNSSNAIKGISIQGVI